MNRKLNKTVLALTAGPLLTVIWGSTALADAGIEGLGYTTGSSFSSAAYAISGDGTTVVGNSAWSGGGEAFRWTSSGGMVGLGDLSGGVDRSAAYGVSDDGSVVVGGGYSGSGSEAFRWTFAGGLVGLGDLTGGSYYSTATGVSGDGKVVVGYSNSSNGYEAFRWTSSGGLVGLGDLSGGTFHSEAFGVNNDGSVVVGRATNATRSEAFRWTASGGMVGLGSLTATSYSEAKAVSGDGSVVVGNAGNGTGDEAFRWTASGGMAGLGILPGFTDSYANAVNGDGTVIVGYNTDSSNYEAFHWTANTGMQSLAEWLADSGYTLTGWTNTMATGVSDDGKIVVGYGETEAFIARGGSGLIGVNDFTQSLQSAGGASAQGIATTQTILHGAHGHPGANRALDDKRFMWVAGDLAHDDRHDSTTGASVAEVGVGYRPSDRLTVSAAVGKTWSDSDLLYSGSSNSNGQYLALDADVRLPGKLPLYATVSYLQGSSDLDIQRGYLNAGSLDASTAKTSQTFQGLRARLQWQSARQSHRFSLHPYVEYVVARVKTDGYTETGGGFPATFDGSTETVHDLRLGTDLDRPISSRTRFLGTLEAVHRAEAHGQGVSGQVIGLSTFAMAGRTYDQDWMRATAGIDHELGKGRLSLTLNASTQGEDPTTWAGINYTRAF